MDDYPQLPKRRRHVPHLTQGELAELTNVSNVVISQIEQGRYPNLTHGLLHRIAGVLNFTSQQKVYLLGLHEPRSEQQLAPEPAPDWVLASIARTRHPVLVINPAYDILGVNTAMELLSGDLQGDFQPNSNSGISLFTIPAVRKFVDDWHTYTASMVSGLRISYAMYPNWRVHIDRIVLQLRATDPWFGECWDRDDPLVKPTMAKTFHHPQLGELSVLQILTDIVEAPGLTKVEFMPADDETAEAMTSVG